MFCFGPCGNHGRMPWTDESARQFGATLRRLRQERGLSQETLAFQAGITKNQVQLIEAGRASGRKDATGPANPRLSTLAGLAGALHLSTAELMSQAGL